MRQRDPDRLVVAARQRERSLGGLIIGLIRVSSSVFTGVRVSAAVQVKDAGSARRTRTPSPENQKVDERKPLPGDHIALVSRA